MKFSVIIPNFNGSNLIIKNLPQVIEAMERFEDWEIIIVDDCSEIEDFNNLESFIRTVSKKNNIQVKLLRNEKNLGFSSTINKGALSSGAELLILLNSDVAPEKNFLHPVISDFKNNPNLFAVGCMDKSHEREKVVLRGRGLARWEKGFLMHRRGEVDKKDTFWVSGGSSVFKRSIFEKLGGMDSLYNPFYWEDIDLSYRARKSGYEIIFEKESAVEHRHEEGAIKKHYSDFQVRTISYRNQFIFVWKNITNIKLIFSHLFWLPYHLLFALLRLDFSFCYGLILAVLRLPDIISKRLKQAKLYSKEDLELIGK